MRPPADRIVAERTAGAVSAPAPRVAALLEQARRSLAAAKSADNAADRYTAAHVAAVRAAAALVAARGSRSRRARPVPVWTLLAQAAPDMAAWAPHFAAQDRTRAAVEAGVTRLVNDLTAADALARSTVFVDAVQARLATPEAGP